MKDKVKNSKRITNIFIFFGFFCFYSAAEELSFEQLMNLYGDRSNWPSCERLADTFCESFHSAENQGNFQFSDGTQILRGDRRKGVISNTEFIHLQKIVKSRCRLPEDIKAMTGVRCGDDDKKDDLFSQLDSLLSQVDSIGKDSQSIKSWRRSIESIRYHLENIINRVAYKRAIEENSDTSKESMDDYTFSKKKVSRKHSYNIRREMINVVYWNDSDWQRVIRVFKEVRQDILTVIDQMAFHPGLKNFMEERVRRMQLSLPYSVPGSSEIDCNKNSHNAKYYPLENRMVVCIGKFNTVLNEGGLYSIIAHEIAHSIDPNSFLLHIFTQTPIYRNLRALRESNSSLSCDDWEKIKNEYSTLPVDVYQLPAELAAIDQCLVDRGHLDELKYPLLVYVSTRLSEELMAYHANRNRFTYLTTPEVYKHGILESNEMYLNPMLFIESANNTIQLGPFHKVNFDDIFVFVQEYRCRRLSLPDISEERAFFEALEETKKLRKIYYYFRFSLFGRNATELIPFNLSKPSLEAFADWISYKAMELKLKRESSVRNRRIFMLSGISDHCESKSLQRVEKNKIFIENRYSRDVYPFKRHRILGHFTSETANLLHCNRGEEIINLDRNCDSLVTD